jgi:hypothetical protein
VSQVVLGGRQQVPAVDIHHFLHTVEVLVHGDEPFLFLCVLLHFSQLLDQLHSLILLLVQLALHLLAFLS